MQHGGVYAVQSGRLRVREAQGEGSQGEANQRETSGTNVCGGDARSTYAFLYELLVNSGIYALVFIRGLA